MLDAWCSAITTGTATADLARLEEAARATSATALVTTVKDQVRFEAGSIPPGLPFLAAGIAGGNLR